MPPKMKFAEGERVLCFHGPLLYEAKCVKSDVKEKTVRYFIHYNGWNKNWDEWVPETRVLKYNDASLQKQKELQKAHASVHSAIKPGLKKTKTRKDKEKGVLLWPDKTKHKSSLVAGPGGGSGGSTGGDGGSTSSVSSTPASSTVGGSSSSTTTEPKRKRAKIDPTVESEETFQAKIEVRIKVPDDLKLWLVDDWDLITKQKNYCDCLQQKALNQY